VPSIWADLNDSSCRVSQRDKCLAFEGFTRRHASSLARCALFLQTIVFVHNLGELPIPSQQSPPAATKDGRAPTMKSATTNPADRPGRPEPRQCRNDRRHQNGDGSRMDLVEISPIPILPFCKIMDYGKFKYSAQKKAAEAARNRRWSRIRRSAPADDRRSRLRT